MRNDGHVIAKENVVEIEVECPAGSHIGGR